MVNALRERIDRFDLWTLLLATIVAIPSLFVGFHFDDWWQLTIVRHLSFQESVLEMFAFSDAGHGTTNAFWWSDPHLKLSFFRPLSSLLVYVDDAVFGDTAVGWHVHQVGWWLLTVWLVIRLIRRELPGRAGVIGGIAFAVGDANLYPVAWLANRNALVSAVFGLWALGAYQRWRQQGAKTDAGLTMLGFTLALLGGESALGVYGYLVAWEFFEGIGEWRTRLRGLFPAFSVLGVWAVAYKLGGHGTANSGAYLDPLGAPIEWLVSSPLRALGLLGQLLARTPVDVWFIDDDYAIGPILGGIVGLPLWGWLLWRLFREDNTYAKPLRWLIVGALLSLLPVLSTFPSSRLLLLPMVGFGATVGVLLDHIRVFRHRVGFIRRWLTRLIGFGALIVAPLSFVAQTAVLARIAQGARSNAAEADLGGQDEVAIVVVSPDPGTALYLPYIRFVWGDVPRAWGVISMAPRRHHLVRTGEATFELEVIDGHLMGTEWERILRDAPLAVGEQLPWGDGTHIDILAIDGKGPTKIAVTLPVSLDDPHVRWLRWNLDDRRLERMQMPPVGGETWFEPDFTAVFGR